MLTIGGEWILHRIISAMHIRIRPELLIPSDECYFKSITVGINCLFGFLELQVETVVLVYQKWKWECSQSYQNSEPCHGAVLCVPILLFRLEISVTLPVVGSAQK